MGITKTPSSLKWLINKRSRLSGMILSLEPKLRNAIFELERAEAAYRAAQANYNRLKNLDIENLKKNLSTIDATIALHEIPVDIASIKPINPKSKRVFPHGMMTKLIFECLKKSDRNIATTQEITVYISTAAQPLCQDISFEQLRFLLGKRLTALASKSTVVRFHKKDGSEEGIWGLPR